MDTVSLIISDMSAWWAGVDTNDLVYGYWNLLSWATIYAAIAIFVSSVDDAFLDLYFWTLQVQRIVTRPFRFVPSLKRLKAMPEKRIAIMVPAWQESDVIARMLMNTLTTLDYAQYDIFVGCYPNDPDTIEEVDRIARQHKQVVRAMVGHDGPTSKADCLNWMIQNIYAHEQKTGQRYDIFAMHDSEDVIHPLSMKVVNAYLDRTDMVQLPVLSMPRKWNQWVACHYMDEFAEWHGKDLIARSHMTALVPSAGVATSFTRRCIDLLCAERDNQPFNTDSLTEDYDVGHRLFDAGLKSAFVRYWAKMPVGERSDGRRKVRTVTEKQLVCTREYFPDRMNVSVKQKSRWMLGISYLGWKQLGWFGPASHRYFLYRDRKAIWTAPTGMLAYAIVFQWLLLWVITSLFPSVDALPPLIDENSWVWTLVLINFAFLVNRVFHRVVFTSAAHGVKHGFLAPIRMVVGNYVGFLASARAVRRFAWHMVSGKRITWDKTMHAYPSMQEIHGRVGSFDEAVKFFGIANEETLERVKADAAAEGIELDEALVAKGYATEEEVASAWAESAGLERIDFDPMSIDAKVRDRLAVQTAKRLAVFPVGFKSGVLDIAAARPVNPAAMEAIEQACGAKVRQLIAPLSDVDFGLRFGWDTTALESDLRGARVLQKLDLLDATDAVDVWTRIRRISRGRPAPLGFVAMARKAGILSDSDWESLSASHPDVAHSLETAG